MLIVEREQIAPFLLQKGRNKPTCTFIQLIFIIFGYMPTTFMVNVAK